MPTKKPFKKVIKLKKHQTYKFRGVNDATLFFLNSNFVFDLVMVIEVQDWNDLYCVSIYQDDPSCGNYFGYIPDVVKVLKELPYNGKEIENEEVPLRRCKTK